MTITALSRLPLELILLIVEHAARSGVRSDTSWVARLCLVCGVFRRVVTPILYGHVTITSDDDDTYECLAATSRMPNTPLVHARSVLFAYDFPEKAYTEASFKSIARALVNVSTFAGPTIALAELLNHVDELTLSSAYLIEIWVLPRFVKVQNLVQTLSYLHLVCNIYRPDWNQWPDLSSYHVEYLVIDLFAERNHLGIQFINLSSMMRLATSPPRLRRVLFRPRLVQQSDVQRTGQAVLEWATAQRDERVHIDDTFVPIGNSQSGFLWHELDEEDSLNGRSVWLQGRQAWRPLPHTLD
ncbi:hypothetical protein EXIGLDRAFT_772383 [Exidia glandulosa HHB12029]|uniref:F-box domain-containing protein n=1 Tax=Exidia glandulosa HHB12029 TaxID=1314781 RepID=A0A165FD29_EXIGL|nr:hypothetical protein EXIGLDRAFT_772383 [Exidia glandulosa HHB12029]